MAYGKRAAPAQEEVHIDIGKSKQISVRQYNGVNLVDIREYYTDKASGELRPGKKGISLTEESWDQLVKNQAKIQKALNKLKGLVDEEDLANDVKDKPKTKKRKVVDDGIDHDEDEEDGEADYVEGGEEEEEEEEEEEDASEED